MTDYRAIADQYEADLKARIASPDDKTAWAAYCESMEYFDGEHEIMMAHKARFFAERRKNG